VSNGLGIAIANALSLAVPSLDAGRGVEASYERWLDHQDLAASGIVTFRETATGDYTGWRGGLGGELRMYRQRMRGWFAGAGLYVDGDFTHDHADGRWIDPTLEVGVTVRGGYRWVPWRQLAITPSVGVAVHHDIDLGGRLPAWTRGGGVVGLDVGWLF